MLPSTMCVTKVSGAWSDGQSQYAVHASDYALERDMLTAKISHLQSEANARSAETAHPAALRASEALRRGAWCVRSGAGSFGRNVEETERSLQERIWQLENARHQSGNGDLLSGDLRLTDLGHWTAAEQLAAARRQRVLSMLAAMKLMNEDLRTAVAEMWPGRREDS